MKQLQRPCPGLERTGLLPEERRLTTHATHVDSGARRPSQLDWTAGDREFLDALRPRRWRMQSTDD